VRAACYQTWDELLTGINPTLETQTTSFAVLDVGPTPRAVSGTRATATATFDVPVPAGRWVEVTWATDEGDWGTQTARLGVQILAD
jgi:hypothetical protein